MRIEPIRYNQFNYGNRPNMAQPQRKQDLMQNGINVRLMMNATSCGSKAEAIELSIKHPGQLFSWNGIVYKNGKQVG